jgi:MYXO-CTERM domain-containing protein
MRLVSKRFVFLAPAFAIALTFLGVGYTSYAFVSLQTGALPLFWGNPNVEFVVNDVADPQISDESDVTAVRQAFQTWNNVASSQIQFNENTAAAVRANTNWRDDRLHTVLWDTNNESGFFGSGSGLVAITPVDFNPSTGLILDADILFNAGGHSFSTTGEAGRFDIQGIATHEVGHFMGLDHTGVGAATMNPFANTADTRLRSLAQDDIAAASAIYSLGFAPGEITGSITRSGGTVSGAHVVAENMYGEPASGCLSDANGNFRIRGLDQGQYVVYVEPLDGPVTSSNFSVQTSNLTINTSFGTTFYGGSPANPGLVMVSSGGSTPIGALATLPQTSMNATQVSHPTLAPNGDVQFRISGSNINRADSVVIPGAVGDALFVSRNPLPQDFAFNGVTVPVTVLSSALPRVRSVRVFDSASGECTVLTGGFEVRMPAPRVEGLSGTSGAPGSVLQIFGENFQMLSRVIFGSQVLAASGQGSEISVSVPNVSNGAYTLVIENPDGQIAKTTFTVAGSAAAAPPPPPSDTGLVAGAAGASGGGGSTSSGSGGGSSGGGSSGGGGGGGGGCSLAQAPSSAPSGGVFLALALVGLLSLRRRS